MNLAEGRLTSVETRATGLETLTLNHTNRLDANDTLKYYSNQ